MSEKCLLRLDTKKVTRKSVKVVKAKRHKLQWCACARPREVRGLQHFLRGTFGLPCQAFQRRGCPGKVLQRNAPCRLLNRPRLWNKSPLFRKKTPTFFEKSPSFFEKSPTFLRKSPSFFPSSPTYWTTLLLKWREKSWISGVSDSMCWSEEAFYDWPLQY